MKVIITGILEWVGECDDMDRLKQHSRIPVKSHVRARRRRTSTRCARDLHSMRLFIPTHHARFESLSSCKLSTQASATSLKIDCARSIYV
jgi:hypothetical protein